MAAVTATPTTLNAVPSERDRVADAHIERVGEGGLDHHAAVADPAALGHARAGRPRRSRRRAPRPARPTSGRMPRASPAMTGYGPLWSVDAGSAWPASRGRRRPANGPALATTSGPVVASRVLWYGSLAASRRTSPSVNVVVAAMMASSRSAASARRRRRSRSGEAAHEQDAAHRAQPSSPTSAPSCPVVPPVSRVSSTNAPSRMEIIRSAVAAIRASWVTMTSVWPGLVQALEEPQDVEGGGAVEVAGRLVGEHDQRLVAQRPGDRDPLPLAAGQRRRQEARPVGEPDPLQQLLRPPAWPPAASVRPAAPAARRSRRR